MAEVNRSLLIVKPRKPFLDWLHSVDPDDKHLRWEDINDDPTAYLMTEVEMMESDDIDPSSNGH